MSAASPVSSARGLYVAEPPAARYLRTPVVIDCSVWVALVFNEPAAHKAAALLDIKLMHAPTLLAYEFANMVTGKRRGGVDAIDIERALREFAQQRIDLHPVAAEAMSSVASRFGLTAYHAAYLWLAGSTRAPLVTFDAKLNAAAAK
ncbi:MAG: type II toxin-antitoxin system VapC family toxin [Pseudomonadota bacterium]|nr:type II toxin-antitoxin system VapC family toxin [Pseudomonadota bacterium]